MKHKQIAIVDWDNSGPTIWVFESEKKITLNRIVKHLEEKEDANFERDSVTLIDAEQMEPVSLD